MLLLQRFGKMQVKNGVLRMGPICNLVRVTMMHWSPAPASSSASIKQWVIGSRKAAVLLPEPVWTFIYI